MTPHRLAALLSFALLPPLTSLPASAAPPGASAEVPILFNDRHVHATPDKMRANRILAALVRGGTVLVPLRSMFEAMGASVSYDAATKSVDVSKPGADVKVTVGLPQVIINGETRPLDVPPEIYQGTLVVPVRVISEGMGAYVEWVPARRVVVVRYVPAPAPTPEPPPPSPAPTAPPTPQAPLAPVPTVPPIPVTPKPISPYEKFVAADFVFSPKVYNEFSPGNTGSGAEHAVAAFEFPLLGFNWFLGGDYRGFSFPHNVTGSSTACPSQGQQGCVDTIGGNGVQTFVPAFSGRQTEYDGRLGVKIADPRYYIDVGYDTTTNNYGYPTLTGAGVGIEKLPDLEKPVSYYGSFFFYPAVGGSYFSKSVEYRLLKYSVGATLGFGPGFPLYLDVGALGAGGRASRDAPSGYT